MDAALAELREVKYPCSAWAAASADKQCYEKVRKEKPPAYVTEILDKVQAREGGMFSGPRVKQAEEQAYWRFGAIGDETWAEPGTIPKKHITANSLGKDFVKAP